MLIFQAILVFEIIIDFPLSSFELSGIGMSSNSARLSSDPGSPTGPLTGRRDSPAQENKNIRSVVEIINFYNNIFKIKPFILNVND